MKDVEDKVMPGEKSSRANSYTCYTILAVSAYNAAMHTAFAELRRTQTASALPLNKT